MKRRIFTFGLFLFSLLGIGTNAFGQSPAAGDYVFTGASTYDWNLVGNWAVSNDGTYTNTTAATTLPTGINNVWIPAGKIATVGLFSTTQSTTATGIVSGSANVTLSAGNALILPGMVVTGTGIASGTTVSSVSGASLTLSQAATTSSSAAVTLTFTNGTSTTQTTTATGITSGNANVTLSATNSLIFAGMVVTGTGIASGTTVLSVSGTSLTLSQPATTTSTSAVTLTFNVISSITQATTATGIISGSSGVTLSSANPLISVGMAVTGSGIASGTSVSSISGTALTLSQPATISSSSAVTLTFSPNCQHLYVAGLLTTAGTLNCMDSVTLYGTNSKLLAGSGYYLNVGGDIFVSSSDTLFVGSSNSNANVYCKNIFNKGTIKAYSDYSGMKSLIYVGYPWQVAGTGDYYIVNDGVFGTPAITGTSTNSTTPVKGGGIKLLYSELANSLTIEPSSTGSSYAFNIGALLPNSIITTSTQSFTLNILENMSLLWNGAGISLSLQNGVQTGGTRTLNIPHNITVYVGGPFHANRTIAGTIAQGNFVYNVYGTLDLASNVYYSAGYPTDFDLCMTTYSGNAGNITFNLGDGTNSASLVLGKSIRLIKQETQALNFNFNTNSTVTFAKSASIKNNLGGTVYTLQNINISNNSYNPAPNLFPAKFYNLTINNDSTILPVAATYKGTYTNTASGYGKSLWVASRTYSLPSYTTLATQGAIIPTGSAYYYVPVVTAVGTYINASTAVALTGDTILNYIYSGQVVNGTGIAASQTVSSISGTALVLSAATTAAGTNATLTFKGTSGVTAPTGISTSTYSPVLDGTQYLIYLGSTTNFAPTQDTSTGVSLTSNDSNSVQVYSNDKTLYIKNANTGDIVSVYSVTGLKVASAVVTSDPTTVDLPTGIYIVKVGNYATKVIVR